MNFALPWTRACWDLCFPHLDLELSFCFNLPFGYLKKLVPLFSKVRFDPFLWQFLSILCLVSISFCSNLCLGGNLPTFSHFEISFFVLLRDIWFMPSQFSYYFRSNFAEYQAFVSSYKIARLLFGAFSFSVSMSIFLLPYELLLMAVQFNVSHTVFQRFVFKIFANWQF